MPELRDKMFLGSKTRFRSRDEAWRDVESIMNRMNVENFDLFQLHSVVNMHELDLATADGGALETLVEMREQGLSKWLGITGHGPHVPGTILESLNRFDFDTVMFPLNPAMARDSSYRHDSEALLAVCAARDIGVQTIKMIARGGWGAGPRDCHTWYDPHREQADIGQVSVVGAFAAHAHCAELRRDQSAAKGAGRCRAVHTNDQRGAGSSSSGTAAATTAPGACDYRC